jgi:hypothetical protein
MSVFFQVKIFWTVALCSIVVGYQLLEDLAVYIIRVKCMVPGSGSRYMNWE